MLPHQTAPWTHLCVCVNAPMDGLLQAPCGRSPWQHLVICAKVTGCGAGVMGKYSLNTRHPVTAQFTLLRNPVFPFKEHQHLHYREETEEVFSVTADMAFLQSKWDLQVCFFFVCYFLSLIYLPKKLLNSSRSYIMTQTAHLNTAKLIYIIYRCACKALGLAVDQVDRYVAAV